LACWMGFGSGVLLMAAFFTLVIDIQTSTHVKFT
jgi:hypothetical protein